MRHRSRLAVGLITSILSASLVVPQFAYADDASNDQSTMSTTQTESVDTATQEFGSTAGLVENPTGMITSDEATVEEAQPRARAKARTANVAGWTTQNGQKAYRQSDGTFFASPALKVIDVSEHQGTINWDQVKKSGVDAVILRIGFCDNLDKYFERNLKEVRRLKIPFGIYLYSYAPDASWAKVEADFVGTMMNKYKLTDMAFPMYYDLEAWKSWEWDDKWLSHPTSPNGYLPVVNTFVNRMAQYGYTNVQIYSYLNYYNNELNHPSIHARAGWVAQYNGTCWYDYPSYTGQRGWQYSSEESVQGINGNVDMNVFDKVPFTDVSTKTPHIDDILWLEENDITTGFSDGTFRGMSSVVRQDMAAFLRRLAAKNNIGDAATWKPSASDWNTFSDVNKGTPHAEDILWLAHADIAEGYENDTYGGMVPVYRQDMAAFLKRLADYAKKSSGVKLKTDFTDVDSSTPHYQEIQWLGGSGVTTGYKNANGTYRFEGMTKVYRQDMAAFLHRLDTLLNK